MRDPSRPSCSFLLPQVLRWAGQRATRPGNTLVRRKCPLTILPLTSSLQVWNSPYRFTQSSWIWLNSPLYSQNKSGVQRQSRITAIPRSDWTLQHSLRTRLRKRMWYFWEVLSFASFRPSCFPRLSFFLRSVWIFWRNHSISLIFSALYHFLLYQIWYLPSLWKSIPHHSRLSFNGE